MATITTIIFTTSVYRRRRLVVLQYGTVTVCVCVCIPEGACDSCLAVFMDTQRYLHQHCPPCLCHPVCSHVLLLYTLDHFLFLHIVLNLPPCFFVCVCVYSSALSVFVSSQRFIVFHKVKQFDCCVWSRWQAELQVCVCACESVCNHCYQCCVRTAENWKDKQNIYRLSLPLASSFLELSFVVPFSLCCFVA